MSSAGDFKSALRTGESNTVEFSFAAYLPRFTQTICAFANTKGGTIYVGVYDSPDGSVEQPAVRSVLGVDSRIVQHVTDNLQAHFDDPLPKLAEEMLVGRGVFTAAVARVSLALIQKHDV